VNLFSISRAAINAVNPSQWALIAVASGYTTDPDGTRRPSYQVAQRVRAQVQDLSSKDLQITEGMNLQGETKAIYLSGNWTGIVREDGRGGDVIQLQDGTVWLVTKVAENWAGARGWVKVVATRQMDKVLP
jgi:hypothetical protein